MNETRIWGLTPEAGGTLTLTGGTGMSGGQDSLFTPLLQFFRPLDTASFGSLEHYFEQKLRI